MKFKEKRKKAGLNEKALTELWTKEVLLLGDTITAHIPPHGAKLYRQEK